MTAILAWLQTKLGLVVGQIAYVVLEKIWGSILEFFRQKKESEDKVEDRNQAVDKAKTATTPEEAFNAQEGIVGREP